MKTLKTHFTKAGHHFRQVLRRADLAIYELTRTTTGRKHYEVIRIKQHAASSFETADGKEVKREQGEHYPASESWGRDGFTFNELSDAEEKLAELSELEADKSNLE